MSSNIPEARERINAIIAQLASGGKYSKRDVILALKQALKLMTRKPREKGTEPKARMAYMTERMVGKVRQCKRENPDLSPKRIARICGTDPGRTAAVLQGTN